MEEPVQLCTCTGIRFCAKCRESARVRELFSGAATLTQASAVIDKQQQSERLSSCSFAAIGRSTYSCCIECLGVFVSDALMKGCDSHLALEKAGIAIRGLTVFQDVLSVEEEERLVRFLDDPAPFPPWKESQSGRRKQDFGPRRNFKKKKLKPADVPAMPRAFQPIFAAISSTTEQCTRRPFHVAEVSVLEYTEGNMSNFDPHVDDTWLWGDRIAGLNLNEASAMTFVNQSGECCDVYFPRRSFFLMSGDCRYRWMHGIRPEHVHGRRISLTFRELSEELLADDATAEMVLSAASTFV
ncbi:2OG-Fe(II) oxygenase superfamily [Novymonas esmeraldas]|uniref:2OG-Fe(II) oxygenase superfamily n=1 Tax=Novymonas esmeraldas TaxID=1808958 RepID=A0AAW0F0K0_9TRYP